MAFNLSAMLWGFIGEEYKKDEAKKEVKKEEKKEVGKSEHGLGLHGYSAWLGPADIEKTKKKVEVKKEKSERKYVSAVPADEEKVKVSGNVGKEKDRMLIDVKEVLGIKSVGNEKEYVEEERVGVSEAYTKKMEEIDELRRLGFNIYSDISIARNKMYESFSPKREMKVCETAVYKELEQRDYMDLKMLLRKNDYMQRCTNTNAKSLVLFILLTGEIINKYLSKLTAENMEIFTKEVIKEYTERSISTTTKKVLTMTDLMECAGVLKVTMMEDAFYESMMDYLANMIVKYNI